jgi:hypothetical protein
MGTIAAPADGIAARASEDSPDLAPVIDAVGDVMIEFVERQERKGDRRRVNGRPCRRVQNTLRAWLRTQAYLLHYKRTPDTYFLICWAEPKAPRKERKR